MADDVHLAFAHPEERSKATAGTPVDRISLRDHIVEAEIGAFQVERGIQQRMSFNVVVEVRPSTGADTDDVDDILSYDRVTEAIAAEMAVERLNLLETLAERVADRILREPQALRVFVRIEKLDRGPGKLGVEIVRSREDATQDTTTPEEVSPVIVYLSNSALGSEYLPGWLDQLAASTDPVIVALAPVDNLPEAGTESAVRHIALLGVEQNAWRLADKDPRCTIVGTKTELDWGMKNGQLSVWAPSKLVLDSVEPVEFNLNQPETLAAWFAKDLHAAKFIVVGGSGADVGMNAAICDVEVQNLPL